jgi:rod shape-determining protein MreC
MVLDHRTHRLSPVRNTLSAIVTPIQYLVDSPIKWVETGSTTFVSRQALLAENTRLRAQQLLLEAKLQKLIALQTENSQLRALLASLPHLGSTQVVIAQLLAVATEPLVSEVVLDKGQRQGVYEGQPVLDAKGIMGQIIQIGPLTSRVLLIDDLRSAIPVQDSRNNVRGIAIGHGKLASLGLTDIPATVDVKVGDMLVTSGLDGHYPAGYPVGVISRVRQDPADQFTAIDVTPTAQLDRNQYVLLIWPPKAPVVDVPKLSSNKPKLHKKK